MNGTNGRDGLDERDGVGRGLEGWEKRSGLEEWSWTEGTDQRDEVGQEECTGGMDGRNRDGLEERT